LEYILVLTMFTSILPRNTEKVLKDLSNLDFIKEFYLAGGTALAMQVGHRESYDLDFFNRNEFQSEQIQSELEKIGKIESAEISPGTLNCFLEGVKLQFLHYPYPILEPLIEWKGINISSKLDLACTKLITISARGSKKDFIDVYFLLKEYGLPFLFRKLKEKYPKTNYNEAHILKSLVYFHDADTQPTPRMHQKIDWQETKKEIINTVKNFKL